MEVFLMWPRDLWIIIYCLAIYMQSSASVIFDLMGLNVGIIKDLASVCTCVYCSDAPVNFVEIVGDNCMLRLTL